MVKSVRQRALLRVDGQLVNDDDNDNDDNIDGQYGSNVSLLSMAQEMGGGAARGTGVGEESAAAAAAAAAKPTPTPRQRLVDATERVAALGWYLPYITYHRIITYRIITS